MTLQPLTARNRVTINELNDGPSTGRMMVRILTVAADGSRMPNDARDDDSGQFTQKYPQSAFRDAIEAEGGLASTAEVAERVGCSRPTAYTKLDTLADDGEIARKKAGHSIVWATLPGLAGQQADSSGATGDESQSPPPEPSGSETEQTVESNAYDAIDSLDLPGSGDVLEARRDAVRAIYDYIRENGKGRKSEFEDLLNTENLGYDSFHSFWKNTVTKRDALDLPGVATPSEGSPWYRYVGDDS